MHSTTGCNFQLECRMMERFFPGDHISNLTEHRISIFGFSNNYVPRNHVLTTGNCPCMQIMDIHYSINISMSFLLFYTVEVSISSFGYFRIHFSLYNALLFGLSNAIFLYYLFHRFASVRSISAQDPSRSNFVSMTIMLVIALLGVLTLLAVLLIFHFYGFKDPLIQFLPAHTFWIPLSIVFMITAYHLYLDQSYPFVVPVQLLGIIVVQRETGVSITSKNFTSQLPTIDLLGGLFSALDLSLKEAVQSAENIEDIVFGDKVVHIAPGKTISTMMIVNKNSLISRSLCQYVNQEFERMYGHNFPSGTVVAINRNDYADFETIFDEVRKYLPL